MNIGMAKFNQIGKVGLFLSTFVSMLQKISVAFCQKKFSSTFVT